MRAERANDANEAQRVGATQTEGAPRQREQRPLLAGRVVCS